MAASVRLLAIDDNPASLDLLSSGLAQPGLEILTAIDPIQGLDLVAARRPHIVITDLVMPGMTGLEVLDRVMEINPSTEVILMTGHYSSETAVEAIKRGASDYLNKPVSMSTLRPKVTNLIETLDRKNKALRLEQELLASSEFEGIIGNSPLMWDMYSRVRRIAPHYKSVLVTGETGTGKDLVSQALHKLSPASRGRLVVLNCSAVVESLFESELFGHVRGSFTGATADKPGLVEHAHGGTLFLDEIGDMPLSTQAKLLRVLQNQEVQRVGSLTARKVDVRIVAATHRDLRAAIQEKTFREDLYYRLSMVEVRVPRLADRTGDLSLLTRHFVTKFTQQFQKEVVGATRRAEIVLARHPWPGNVRELENVIGHAVMMTQADRFDVPDLPPYLHEGSDSSAVPSATTTSASTIEEQERLLVVQALESAQGNQVQAAKQLRIGRDALRYKMKKYGLDAEFGRNRGAVANPGEA